MPWTTRLREAAYNSPSGVRIKFIYEDVSRSFAKRDAIFEFAGVNESYVQQNGFSARRYPLRCIFAGANCDLEATAFEAALLEHGIGRLEHPLYGPVDVVPTGEITRRDDLKTAANQTIVEVMFSTTLVTLYPSSQAHPQSEILAALEGFDVAAAQSFVDSTNLEKAADRASLKGSVNRLLDDVGKSLDGISDAVASVTRTFHDIEDTINHSIDVFIGKPLLLAQQISDLIKAPARAFAGIQDRLDAYGALADSIFASPAGRPEATLTGSLGLSVNGVKAANAFHLADLAAMGALAGAIIAAVADPISDPIPADQAGARRAGSRPTADLPGVGARISTRPQAIKAAEAIVARFEALVAWRDAGFATINSVPLGVSRVDPLRNARLDTGEAYQQLQQAVALAAGYLIEVSFSRVPERRLVLDRPRTIIDLCAELYGSVDDKLDLMIVTNNLSGDEILELSAGRSVVYYPEAA